MVKKPRELQMVTKLVIGRSSFIRTNREKSLYGILVANFSWLLTIAASEDIADKTG